jgi:capsular polysaccharide biosynthesis protein
MSVSGRTAFPAEPPDGADPPVDLTGVVGALRRGRRLVVAIVVVVTGVALVASLTSPERYRASARIAEGASTAEPFDVAAADRRLATSRELVTAPAVLTAAAGRVPGESPDSLAAKVEANLDITASILDVAATDTDPARAAQIANAVATTFLAERDLTERDAVTRARERLAEELQRQRRAGAADTTLNALRRRLSELAVDEVVAGSSLRLVQPASVPVAPFAPSPVRTTIVAFVAALLCGLLVALARDRLQPQAPGAEALAELTGLPIIAALPRGDARGTRRAWPTDQALIEEAALQAGVRAALPPLRQHVVVVHAAGNEADAASVAVGLVRSLNWAGQKAVLVQLASPDDPPERPTEPRHDVPTVRCTDHEDELEELRRTDYRYVVVPSPEAEQGRRLRMLGDERTAVVLVARLGRTSTAQATAARRLVDALGLHALGLAVTCSAREARAIAATGFAAPVRMPERPHAARTKGAVAAVAERGRAL